MGWMGEVHYSDRTKAMAGAAAVYTAETDFCRLFNEDMRALYALSLVLTADSGLAEQCFVAGLDDCINGNPVFRDWAHAWSRRAIIMNAIRSVFAPADPKLPLSTGSEKTEWSWAMEGPLTAVIRFTPLERFVFVMSFLEGYSDHECSVLLNKSRREVASARALALKHLAEWIASTRTQVRSTEVRGQSAADSETERRFSQAFTEAE